VIPAIDLRRGRVVRLEQGDFGRETDFGADPVELARGFVDAGARWVHVVDLDGAREGAAVQVDVVRSILAAAGDASVELAGGLRDAAAVEAAIEAGAARAVLGTVAITRPDVVSAAIERHGAERIAVAIDVRAGRALGDAWLDGAPARDADRLVEEVSALGVTTIIVTAIERDGLLGGPALDLLERCLAASDAAVIASGGIATIDDLRAVRALGCGGAIVGRAIYDGRINLGMAIRALEDSDSSG
jgi:phosphoribosylformimino-5-aminoimidazole carboxamide ribotide isomerase